MYPLDFVIVPSFKDKIFVEEPVQVKENREDWLKAVIAAVEEKVHRPDKKNRAVLLINLTINDTDEMLKILKEKGIKVRKFSRNDIELLYDL